MTFSIIFDIIKYMKKLFIYGILAGFMFFFPACSGGKNYALLLWGLPEHNLQDLDIVPVYIKSNISQVYVIGLPGTKEKIEVPLWQITEPQKKSKILKLSAKYEEYKHQYANVKIDGLPIRSEPVNTSKQVYRLRKNETVRLLYKGKGQAPMVGKKPLEGNWLKILTQDGTVGWCFSYNLAQFTIDSQGNVIGTEAEEIQEEDVILKSMLAKRWYPDSYSSMIRDQHINPDRMNSSYGFETGAESGTVKLILDGINVSWPYNGVTKTPDKTYKYNDIPVEITVRKADYIVLRYTGADGKPKDFNMVTISENIDELIAKENLRRTDEYAKLYTNGGNFQSSNYGQLTFNVDGTFEWTDYKFLVPSLISKKAGNTGTVSIKYFISDSLKANYDGILTFKFDNMSSEVNFLYKMEKNNIRMADASDAVFRNETVIRLGSSPLILYFAGQ